MSDIFPEPILKLPVANMPWEGVSGYLSQSTAHQILFTEYTKDVEMPEHSHGTEWGVVLEGKMEMVVEGVKRTYSKGDRYLEQAWEITTGSEDQLTAIPIRMPLSEGCRGPIPTPGSRSHCWRLP